jgi:hypothetical protein
MLSIHTSFKAVAVARKSDEDRCRRQAQPAKSTDKYQDRPRDKVLHQNVEGLLTDDKSYSYIAVLLGCFRYGVSKINKRLT